MVTRKSKTGLVKYDAALAEAAKKYAGQEAGAAGGSFISLRGGVISFGGAPVPGNHLAVVILDHVHENCYYEGDFDPEAMSGPVCFAFGRDPASLAPHEGSTARQSESCDRCARNAWGSSERGRGKACRNTRRLALIYAGELDARGAFTPKTDQDHFETTQAAFLKLPVTSVRGFAGYVHQLASNLQRPPFGVFTKMSVVPDPRTQFKVVFEMLDQVPTPLVPTIINRHEEIASIIEFPYVAVENAPATKPKPKPKPKRESKPKPSRSSPAVATPSLPKPLKY